jgi:NADPH:quinone reductase-like Zn-dependent oxidoreductase
MRAIQVYEYGGPEQLRYGDAPAPQIEAGQVLVRVHATSVNPWDYKLASGAFREHVPLRLPYIPGGDFSGVIEGLGAGASGLKQGDSVYGNCPTGAYAELVAAPASTVAPKPNKLSHIEAASVPVAAQTAWQALLEHGELQRGQTVLIHAAAGGVGSFAVQLARWKGARVLATGSAANAAYVKSLGADEVIDYKATPFESVARNVDLVLDLVGGDTQTRSFGVLKSGGCLVATSQPPSQDEAKRRGVRALMMNMQPSKDRLTQLAGLLDSGAIKTIVTQKYALAKARDAWQQSTSRHTRGKIVLEVVG